MRLNIFFFFFKKLNLKEFLPKLTFVIVTKQTRTQYCNHPHQYLKNISPTAIRHAKAKLMHIKLSMCDVSIDKEGTHT